jgi:hypothetical protein
MVDFLHILTTAGSNVGFLTYTGISRNFMVDFLHILATAKDNLE